jgi:hypothetical protein
MFLPAMEGRYVDNDYITHVCVLQTIGVHRWRTRCSLTPTNAQVDHIRVTVTCVLCIAP